MTIVVLVLLAAVACFLSHLIMRAVSEVSMGAAIVCRLILAPGILRHEMAHAAACFLTNTRVHKIAVWDQRGGYVIHSKPRCSEVVQPLISLAPVPVGISSMLLLCHLMATTDSKVLFSFWAFLAVSIAATLAPSKADTALAVKGLPVFGAALASAAICSSLLNQSEAAPLAHVSNHMLLVDFVLFVIWLTLRGVVRLARWVAE